MTEELDEEHWKNQTINSIDYDECDEDTVIIINGFDIWINAKTGISMELAIRENVKKVEQSAEEIVPRDLHEYLDVFNDEKANRFPESKIWDHKIEMKEGFEPKSFKNYNLSPAEQNELDKFLKENLDKGYIRPFKISNGIPILLC